MQYAIIVSKKDQAGLNIKDSLIKLFNFKEYGSFENEKIYSYNNIKLYSIESESIYAENIDQKIDADVFIFATKHKATGQRKTLCCHMPGNWGKAEMGGKDKTLCFAFASLIREIFIEMNKLNNLEYSCTLECDHHGPVCNKPVMFIEIGSSSTEWQDKNAADTIAKTIFNVITQSIKEYKTTIGIGGPHYCDNFNKVLLRTEFSISHICPSYHLGNLDKDLVLQAINKSKEKIEFVILDWKGLGQEKQKIVSILNELNLRYYKIKEILKN